MKKYLDLVYTSVAGALIIAVLFEQVIRDPNAFLYSLGGDAIKSYFNFGYYLKFDDGIRHDGINYPYGDHLQYINSHPLYVQVLGLVDKVTPVASSGVGIMNMTMLFLFWASIPFLYLILRHYGLPKLLAGIWALLIGFLSPQLERIGGHFEMVYAVFIPAYWYFLIRWEKSIAKKWVWAFCLILMGLIGGFTSAYFVAFYAIFILAYVLSKFLMDRSSMGWRKTIWILLMAVVPLILVRGLVGLTDWVDDRPDNPWGFFVFHSNLASIFYPKHSPLSYVLPTEYEWEGKSYVGLVVTVVLASLGINKLIHLVAEKQNPLLSVTKPGVSRELNTFLLAGIITLVFAMCIPFKWGMFGFVLDWVPPIKQFRALGRFSWIFYYTASVFCAYWLWAFYELMKEKQLKQMATAMLVVSSIFWGFDVAANIKQSIASVFNSNDVLRSVDEDYESFLEKEHIQGSRYQAIYCLPFASTCGDKLLFEGGMNAFIQGMKCSYRTGIPLIQSFSPRLSYSNALSSIQLLAGEEIYKTRVKDMGVDPILLITTKEELNKSEQSLLDKAQKISEYQNVSHWQLEIDSINASHKRWLDMIQVAQDSLIQIGDGLWMSDKEKILVSESFDAYESKEVFCGEGALYSEKGPLTIMQKQKIGRQEKETYEFSFWLFVDHREHNMPQAKLYVYDGDKRVEEVRFESREVHDVIGKWIRVSKDVEVKADKTYELVINGRQITVDELLVRPMSSNVKYISPQQCMLWNNFLVE